MRKTFLLAAATAALSFGMGMARGQSVLMYSFETGDSPNSKDGFIDNGPGFTLSNSTTGATQGLTSLKMVTSGGGYIGAYTTSDLPTVLTNPNLAAFTFDVTNSASDPAYTGTFSDLGFTLFVSNPGEGEYGDQYGPPTSDYANIDLAPGTVTVSVPNVGNDPDTGLPISFAGLLGEGWSVSGFQITDSENGVQTFYVDNINAVVPEPASLSVLGLGSLALFRRRRKA